MTYSFLILAVWHRMARIIEEDGRLGKHLACRDIPVMEIVEAFRAMGGVRGHNSHRAFPVPTYEYEKGRTPQARETLTKFLAGQQPLPVQETSPANAALPQQGATGSGADGSGIAEEDCHMADVDAANDNGHFARWGEAAPQRRGELAGTHFRNGVQLP
jgi:hypothetical protein